MSESIMEELGPPKREWHGSHHEWSYRAEAFRWSGVWIAGVNFVPLAKELRQWLQQAGQLTVLTKRQRDEPAACTNPYSYSGSAIALVLSRAVNSLHEYSASSGGEDDALEAEAERIRRTNEILISSARFCEVVVKQLLYLTQIPMKRYERMALGELLEAPCPDCKPSNGKARHKVSLLGTLACPYFLCREFDHCAMDHLAWVNSLRNKQAAHSDGDELNPRNVQESKEQLVHDASAVLNGFVHLLTHIEKLEIQVLRDLANKGAQINVLKQNGLSPEDCYFRLMPNECAVQVDSGTGH